MSSGVEKLQWNVSKELNPDRGKHNFIQFVSVANDLTKFYVLVLKRSSQANENWRVFAFMYGQIKYIYFDEKTLFKPGTKEQLPWENRFKLSIMLIEKQRSNKKR